MNLSLALSRNPDDMAEKEGSVAVQNAGDASMLASKPRDSSDFPDELPSTTVQAPSSLAQSTEVSASGELTELIILYGKQVALASLPEDHQKAFRELARLVAVEGGDRNCKPYNEPDYLNRILVARNLKVPEAWKMWECLVSWRRSYRPDAMTPEEAQPYLARGVLINCGPDKHNRPVCHIVGKNHLIDAANQERNLRTIVWNLERMVATSEKTADGYLSLIIDIEGVGRKNMDTGIFISKPGLVQILQEFYPERLGACLILNASWVFKAMWMIISPFLDEKTRSKVHVLARPTDLLEYVELEQLSSELQCTLRAALAAATEGGGRKSK